MSLGHSWPRPEPEDWRRDAACQGMNPAVFFATDPAGRRAALNVCADCPVRTECLEDALSGPRNDDYGIRGGTTSEQRRRIHTQRNPRPAAECGTLSGWRKHQRSHTTVCGACRAIRAEYVRRLRVRQS